jgi:hypothetical protein
VRRRQGGALVELHHDICAELIGLQLDRSFWRQAMFAAIGGAYYWLPKWTGR